MADDADNTLAKKLVENLQGDLRALCSETKKKCPNIKGVSLDLLYSFFRCAHIILPFLLGCESKQPRLVQISLSGLHRLVSFHALNEVASVQLVDELWSLMESEIEELRILQTVALLISPERVVRGEALAKCLVICFRLNFTKDPTVVNTASATVRQLVCQVFERLRLEKPRELKINRARPPQAVSPFVSDAIMLFQDLCRLINGEPPFWLKNITEMTRTLGLDILEMILVQSSTEFLKRPEFTFLIKDQVCPMLIRLFSNMKHSAGQQHQMYAHPPPEVVSDKPYFPVTLRLLRLMGLLITRYYVVLTTECEIFLSLLIRFLDEEKLLWQRALAIELIEKIASYPELINLLAVFDAVGKNDNLL
ncbi:unnamed protein product [Soboliphyme baturini]|uniref:Protein MON2 homolog n=1 Tax=Soboliphyme baturini TaxID=241478 RepID=A0A183INV6_9BILA|nr:unnamed protein product [Soboliphyme baturini]